MVGLLVLAGVLGAWEGVLLVDMGVAVRVAVDLL